MSILTVLRETAARFAERIAVETEREAVSYRELGVRSARITGELSRRAIGAGDLVGLCAASSAELVAGVLGTLAAGAGFVLLDPAYPRARLAAMLALARPKAIWVDGGTSPLEALADQVRLPLALASDPAVAPVAAPGPGPSPRDVAYVVFTSGTTGAPKGVVVEHAGLQNLVERQIEAFELSPESRALQFASPSFDAFVSELLTTLCAGATLCLTGRAGARFDADIADVLERRRISVVTLPPSLLRALPDRPLPALRTLVSAGEACTAEVVARWAPGRTFINAYGPSEVTVCSTMIRLAAGDTPTLGHAMGGLRTYVLDEQLAPVAPGATGELCVAGIGVARGYLGRPDLTAEKFLPDPHAPTPGQRMYRTGDRVRLLPGGDLEFLGRVDHQVKIRGFRIEPAEIELVLRGQPGVRDVLVAERHRPSGEAFLVGYVLGDEPVDEAALRALVARQLPTFMRPAQYVPLRAWPMTSNGKVDRAALARLPLGGALGAPPATDTERQVAGWFADLLGMDAVAVDRSFFELGGDSVLVLRLIARIHAARGIRLPLARVFERPSARALAGLLDAGGGAGHENVVPLAAGGSGAPLWLIAPVHGNALCYMTLAARLAGPRPILGLNAPGLDGETAAIDDFARLAAQHVATIRTRQPTGPYLLAGWSLGGSLAFEVARQLQAVGEEVAGLALIGATPPSPDHIEAARATMSPYEVWRIAYMYTRTMTLSFGIDTPPSLDRFRGLDDAAALALLAESLRGLGPFDGAARAADIASWLGVFRASLKGFHHYVDRGPFRGRALVVHPTGVNAFLTRDPLVVRAIPPGDWARHIEGPIATHHVGGNHYNLVQEPWSERVAQLLSDFWDADTRRATR